MTIVDHWQTLSQARSYSCPPTTKSSNFSIKEANHILTLTPWYHYIYFCLHFCSFDDYKFEFHHFHPSLSNHLDTLLLTEALATIHTWKLVCQGFHFECLPSCKACSSLNLCYYCYSLCIISTHFLIVVLEHLTGLLMDWNRFTFSISIFLQSFLW